jgi:hypothetical protein
VKTRLLQAEPPRSRSGVVRYHPTPAPFTGHFFGGDAMTKYLISFPASAMNVPSEDMAAVGDAARSVIREAKIAGVYVFGGGIDARTAPVLVGSDGATINETYPQTRNLDGGFCVLDLPSREAAVQWAAKLAKACRCSQELREFMFDPES